MTNDARRDDGMSAGRWARLGWAGRRRQLPVLDVWGDGLGGGETMGDRFGGRVCGRLCAVEGCLDGVWCCRAHDVAVNGLLVRSVRRWSLFVVLKIESVGGLDRRLRLLAAEPRTLHEEIMFLVVRLSPYPITHINTIHKLLHT